MRVRWVIAGMFAIIGGFWLVTATLLALEVEGAWWRYAVCPIAAFVVGALMVAHAPLRPWREPVAAVALAAATGVLAMLTSEGVRWTAFWSSLLLRPWYAGLGVAALSGVMAAAGGLAVRRVAAATLRTHLVVVLSVFVATGAISVMGLAVSTWAGWLFAVLGGVAAGGFIMQAAIAARRPWACGGGGGGAVALLALFSWERQGEPPDVGTILGGLIFVLIGYAGARLAWRLLRRGAPAEPEVPSARLGRG